MAFRSLRPQSVRGRQAEARRNDLVVLEAARDVFTAQGAGAPVSAVAERAGVGMGTLYRRYGSKAELLQHLCLLAMEQALAAADEALAALAGQIETTAEMRSTARRSMARVAEIVARAQADGSLRADVTALDISWLIEQFSRRSPGQAGPEDPDEERNVRSRLVAIALDGLQACHAPGALPGRPPSRSRYVHRWSPRS